MDALSCDALSIREVNHHLRRLGAGAGCSVTAPRGKHNLAVGITETIDLGIDGNAGYFLGGLSGRSDGTGPDITVGGFVGWSVGENLMGGTIRVKGSASQSAASSARGARWWSRVTPACGPASP